MVAPSHVIGLDLHGTLLEPGEIIRPEFVTPVAAALKKIRTRAQRFICTGNDLAFVLRKVPGPILAEIDGCVLETGCSMSPDLERETVLTSQKERDLIFALTAELEDRRFSEINYFAHRLTTISMFCDSPREFFERVESYVRKTDFYERVHITYSSVAVDILPRGYDKHRGLAKVAGGKPTIGVADSMNDRALLEKSDSAFAPANLAPELKPLLESQGRKILPLSAARGLVPRSVIVANKNETQGVIEILEFLDQNL